MPKEKNPIYQDSGTRFALQKMTPRHYKILDYAIAGITNTEIAKKLSMSAIQVGMVINSPSFQHQFALRRKEVEGLQAQHDVDYIDDVKSVLQENARAAADKLISGLDSLDDKIGLKSATEILDRTGYPKEQKGMPDAITQITINSADFKILQESLEIDGASVSSE